MNLSIIIVNYNTRNLLQDCLKSIYTLYPKPYTLEVIVVDNGSTDGTKEMLKKLQTQNSELRTIFNKKNEGFAKAVNQGIKQAQGKYFLLLNSDIMVKAGAIEKMLAFVESHPEAGVVGGCLLNPNGSIQGSCYYLQTIFRVIREFWFYDKKISVTQKYAPSEKKFKEVEAVTGAVFLIPKKIVEKIGLFDERFFIYFEDLDYCRRVRKTSFKVYYLPQAEFIHQDGASGKKMPGKTHQWLVASSKIYHGQFRYYLITFIIWTGQKCQKILKKK